FYLSVTCTLPIHTLFPYTTLFRSSIIAKTTDGKYIVTPDNGTLTHVYENIGIEEIREIDESTNRLPNSGESYTFHGRDVYAYTGARLAAGIIDFEASGRRLE